MRPEEALHVVDGKAKNTVHIKLYLVGGSGCVAAWQQMFERLCWCNLHFRKQLQLSVHSGYTKKIGKGVRNIF